MDDETPPVRRLTLKAKDVIPTDQVSQTGDGTAISVQLMHRVNKLAADKLLGADPGGASPYPGATARPAAIPFRPKSEVDDAGGVDAGQAAAEEISVHQMLRANRAAAKEVEPELIAMPAPRRSRRRQDFALVLGLAAGATAILTAVFRHNPQIVALGMFIIVFITVILGWVMFGVMEKY